MPSLMSRGGVAPPLIYIHWKPLLQTAVRHNYVGHDAAEYEGEGESVYVCVKREREGT